MSEGASEFRDVDDGLWYQLRSADDFLYHYTSASVLTDHIIPTGQIRFSSFEHLNDPYEYRQLSFVWEARQGFNGGLNERLKSDFANRLRQDIRIACFCADPPGSVIPDLSNPQRLTEAPYQRGHSLAQMWAHYGADHAGACLVFSKPRLLKVVRTRASALGLRFLHGAVRYWNWPVIISDRLPSGFRVDYDKLRALGAKEMARRHVSQEAGSLFLSKTGAWAAEQEYRLLLWGQASPYVGLNFGDALVGIMLGERFPATLKPIVGRHAVENKVRTAAMDWLNGFPQPRVFHPTSLCEALI